MTSPGVFLDDSNDVWVIWSDGRPRLLNSTKARFEDLGFRSIAEVDADPFFGPTRPALLEG